jgi:hypothetical protein
MTVSRCTTDITLQQNNFFKQLDAILRTVCLDCVSNKWAHFQDILYIVDIKSTYSRLSINKVNKVER